MSLFIFHNYYFRHYLPLLTCIMPAFFPVFSQMTMPHNFWRRVKPLGWNSIHFIFPNLQTCLCENLPITIHSRYTKENLTSMCTLDVISSTFSGKYLFLLLSCIFNSSFQLDPPHWLLNMLRLLKKIKYNKHL